MTPALNPAVETLPVPPVPEVQGWARAYDGSRGPLIDLSQAVPGYPPPPEMLGWLAEAAGGRAATGYGAIEGEDALRSAYAAHVSEVYGAKVSAVHTHVTAGCNQAFLCTAMAVAGAGDRVLMTRPCYFNHETTLDMMGVGAAYVDCPAEGGFLPDPDAVRAAIGRDVRALALVSPNNPTGRVYPAALLEELFGICREAGIWMILDETYRDFMPPGERHRLLSRGDWSEGLALLYSFSKSFCIPGHRLGAVVAGERMIAGIAKVMDNLQICAPRAAQMAVATGIGPLAGWREGNRIEIERRAAAMRAAMADAPGWEIGAMGAYFAYVRHPFRGRGSVEVARMLATEAGVSSIPGAFFGEGQDDWLRLAFANVDAETIAGLGARLRGVGLS